MTFWILSVEKRKKHQGLSVQTLDAVRVRMVVQTRVEADLP